MKKYIYLIILGIALFGIGIIVLVFQMNEMDYISKDITKRVNVLEYNDNKEYKVECGFCKVKYVHDDVENTEIRISYPSNYYNYTIEEDNEGKRRIIEIDIDEVNSKNVYDLIISDLKNGSVRDYFNGFLMEVEVVQKNRARWDGKGNNRFI